MFFYIYSYLNYIFIYSKRTHLKCASSKEIYTCYKKINNNFSLKIALPKNDV